MSTQRVPGISRFRFIFLIIRSACLRSSSIPSGPDEVSTKLRSQFFDLAFNVVALVAIDMHDGRILFPRKHVRACRRFSIIKDSPIKLKTALDRFRKSPGLIHLLELKDHAARGEGERPGVVGFAHHQAISLNLTSTTMARAVSRFSMALSRSLQAWLAVLSLWVASPPTMSWT